MVDSISKTNVSFDLAAAIVRDAFGADAELVECDACEEGWFNAVHRLALADGRTCILKVAPPPDVRVLTYEHDLMTTEVDALRLVRARTRVPVPEVLWWDPSCRRVPSALFLMQECDGVLLSSCRGDLDEGQQATIDAQLAGFLAQLHTIAHPAFGRPDPTAPAASTWSRAFGALVDDLLADGRARAVALPVAYDAIHELVAASADALDQVTTPRFVHWDLWDTNVFVDPASLTVLGVIDFERVLWADPLMEAQFVAKRADDALVAAYGTPLFESSGAVRRRQLYDLYLYLVMTIESAYRNYPTDEIEQFARLCLDATLAELGAG